MCIELKGNKKKGSKKPDRWSGDIESETIRGGGGIREDWMNGKHRKTGWEEIWRSTISKSGERGKKKWAKSLRWVPQGIVRYCWLMRGNNVTQAKFAMAR